MNIRRRHDIAEVHVGFFSFRNLLRIDWILVALTLMLIALGLVTLYSASKNTSSETTYMVKQMVAIGAGMAAAALIICIDLRILVSLAPIFYGLILILLIAVEVFGKEVKGGQRWLALGPVHLQPSEWAKVTLIYMLAWYFSTIKKRVRKMPFFFGAFVVMGIPAVLILKQPNLGTALSLFPITVVMLYVAGCRWWHLAIVMLAGLAAAPVAWNHLKPYQKERLLAFTNPEADPMGTGWQTRQSKITIGSGGMSGKGYGKGTQTYFNYLPEHHTDFIFSHLAEEWGFVGTSGVLILMGAFFLRGLSRARDCPDMAGSLLMAGCIALLSFHTVVNVAITVGLMPVTGIPLPFLSYGGSFYITTLVCVGVMLNAPIRAGLFDS